MSLRYLVAALVLVFVSMHHVLSTTAEVELDVESGKLEVAVYFTPRDLEAALTAQEGRAIRLDKEEKIDSLIEKYMDQHFDLLFKDGSEAAFTWVGSESELRDMWVYFELDAKGSLKDCTIKNTLLEGLGEEYVGTVKIAKPEGGSKSLRFGPEQKTQSLN